MMSSSVYGYNGWYGKTPAMGQESIPFGSQLEAVDKAMELLTKAGKLHHPSGHMARYGYCEQQYQYGQPHHQQQRSVQHQQHQQHHQQNQRQHNHQNQQQQGYHGLASGGSKNPTAVMGTFQQGLVFPSQIGYSQGQVISGTQNYTQNHSQNHQFMFSGNYTSPTFTENANSTYSGSDNSLNWSKVWGTNSKENRGYSGASFSGSGFSGTSFPTTSVWG